VIVSVSQHFHQLDSMAILSAHLFSLVVRNTSNSGLSSLNIWYLNDATVGGSPDQVAAETTRIKREAALIGLSLNYVKCEAISDDDTFLAKMESVLPGCRAELTHLTVTSSAP